MSKEHGEIMACLGRLEQATTDIREDVRDLKKKELHTRLTVLEKTGERFKWFKRTSLAVVVVFVVKEAISLIVGRNSS